MADYDDLLKQIPVADIAKKLGIDEGVAEDAVAQIIPGLVGGMKANADEGGEASLTKALAKHSEDKISSVDDIDTADGSKIVKNVFGDNTDKVAAKLAGGSAKSDVTSDLIEKILPIVAPIVLAWLANRFFGGSDQGAAKKADDNPLGGLGDLLGSVLGGGTSSSSSSGGGLDLGGLLGGLGGLLGGGKK